MTGFSIHPATRQGIKPLIVPFSESGCGKTMSSLLIARGFVGPQGKIGMIDSESGRGSLYADVIPGGYDVLNLDPPFSPSRYREALQAIYDSGAQIAVIDSGSHEWEGIGGVLELAADNEAKSGKPGLHCWKAPKLEHQKFVLSLLQSPIPVICCLRAKFKSRQKKDERGKTVIVKDDNTSPIQAEDFIFEATVHFEILFDHSIRLTKCSHPSLKSCFPSSGPITIQHGELLAKWCNNPGTNPTTDRSSGKSVEGIADSRALKSKLWEITVGIHGCPKVADKATKEAAAQRLTQWLIDESILSDTETLADLHNGRLAEVVDKVEFRLNNPPVP